MEGGWAREGGDKAWAGLVRGEGEDPFKSGGSGGRGGLSGPCDGDGCWDEEGLPSLAPPLAEGRGFSVPHRPFTHGASSTAPRTTPAAPLLTGDWERSEGGSGPRGAGVALIGEGRELRLGLRGARPDGAWEKTTTHWPTWGEGSEETPPRMN